jgi:hypothetical protein
METTARLSAQRSSRLVESPDPNDRGRGPQPRKATRRTTTRCGYLLLVRRPGKPREDDEDHDGHRVAQDG